MFPEFCLQIDILDIIENSIQMKHYEAFKVRQSKYDMESKQDILIVFKTDAE